MNLTIVEFKDAIGEIEEKLQNHMNLTIVEFKVFKSTDFIIVTYHMNLTIVEFKVDNRCITVKFFIYESYHSGI